MFRRIICTFWALAVAGALRVPAQAAQTGSIRILPKCGNEILSDGSILLYRVGIPQEGGYRVTDGLADWTIWTEDIYSEEVKQWILKQERKEGILGEAVNGKGVMFSDLVPGLYLAVQQIPAPGYFAFSPQLVEVPEEENWKIEKSISVMRDAPIPQTSDRPAPIIGAMGLGFAITLLMLMIDQRK